MRSKFTRFPHHEIGRLALLALVVALAGCTAVPATGGGAGGAFGPTQADMVTVEYRLSSPNAGTVVEVHYGDIHSDDARQHQSLPWSTQVTVDPAYNFVNLRATDENQGGDLICEIVVNGQVVDRHEVSTGGYAVVGCFEDLGK